jgi:transcription factor WhiB
MAFDDGDGCLSLDRSAMKPAAVLPDDRSGVCRPLRRAGVESVAPDQAGLWAWMEHAACRGVGASEFFGPAAVGRKRCRACPVIEICFWWAIVAESDLAYRSGIWGGASPAVRAQVAWVTGVDYARSRFAACAAQWAHGCRVTRLNQRRPEMKIPNGSPVPTLIVDGPGDDGR